MPKEKKTEKGPQKLAQSNETKYRAYINRNLIKEATCM